MIDWQPTTIQLSELVPWERNPKSISRAHAQRLLALWERLGQFQTIAIGPGGEVYDGHQRLSVLLAAHGGKYTVQALQSDRALTEAEREELVIAAHVGTVGQFDWNELSNWDAGALQDWGMDAELLQSWNSDAAALATMLEAEEPPPIEDAEPQIDRAEELREKWGVESGQLWQLGEHRLICGDCTDAAVVERVMGGERADMVLTSPPYNRGTTTGGGFNSGGLSQQLTNAYASYADDLSVEQYRQWQSALLISWWNMLSDDGAIYYNHRPRVQAGLFETPLDWNPGLPLRQIIIWHSGSGINFAPTHYRVSHEWIMLFAKPSFRLSSKGISGVGDVWQFGAVHIPGHPAPFPVELAEQAISTTECRIVYEPFSGSGTTLIACEQLGRRCRAIEISPAYVAVALQRWADATSRTPELVS